MYRIFVCNNILLISYSIVDILLVDDLPDVIYFLIDILSNLATLTPPLFEQPSLKTGHYYN